MSYKTKLFRCLSLIAMCCFSSIAMPTENGSFTTSQICKAGIAKVMGRDPTGMKIDRISGKIIFISYVRADDRKKFSYKCKVSGKRIIWGSATGRWREHSMDSKVSFKTNGDLIEVVDQFNDGSRSKEKFNKNQLSD